MSTINTNWVEWENRNSIADKDQPAIYYIAFSDTRLTGTAFSFIKEIVYIGMTISRSGLKGRLDQFESAMRGRNGVHGGAERVRFKHPDADIFFARAYVSVCIFRVSAGRETSADWRIKGDCVGHEYKSFAEYLDIHGRLPEFNDQTKSKKK
jgi:hypothetical protein